MGSGDRFVKDVYLRVRVSDELKLILEIISVAQCTPVSEIVRQVLDNDKTVTEVRAKLYDMVNSTGGDDRP